VGGDRVAVVEVLGGVGGGERDAALVVEADERVLGVDLLDDAAVAVDDLVGAVVAAADDLVAGGVAAFAELDVGAGELAVVAEALAGAVVEVGDVDAPVGEHHGVVAVGSGGVPVADHPVAELLAGVGSDQAVAVGQVARPALGVSTTQRGQCLALLVVALAAEGRELGAAVDREGAEATARLDLGKLAIVADEDELAVALLGLRSQRGEVTGADHARLVDDEHAQERQAVAMVERVAQLADRRGLDGRLVAKLSCGPGGEGAAEHLDVAAGPGFPSGVEREGLARSGRRADDLDGVTVTGERADHLGLLALELATLESSGDEVVSCQPATRTTALTRAPFEVALGFEDRPRRVGAVPVGALDRDRVGEEPVGGAVDLRAARAVAVGGGDRLDDVAPIERGGMLGERVELHRARGRRPPGSSEHLGEGGAIEAELVGASAPAVALLTEGDVVVLALARGQGGGRRGGSGVLPALAHEPFDLLAALGELAQDLARDAFDLCGALGDLAPAELQPVGELVAQGGLVDEPGGLGVRVEPSSAVHQWSRPCTRFRITTWVWSSGSPAREARCWKAAPTKPLPGTFTAPPAPRRAPHASLSR
jgi:hypothetical protein